jgi:hypothetical protein
MEPQSLKGQLNIQYRHDVQAVLRSMPSIGAIYVNGSKYPPEKSTAQTSPSSQNAPGSFRTGSSSAAPNVVVGSSSSAGSLPHHLSSQDRSAYMQMLMNHQQPHGSGSSQGPALTLPGSRRMASITPQMVNAGSRAWPSNLVPAGAVPISMVGQSQGQSLLAARGGSSFQPMRLHHRPVDGSLLGSSAPPMVLGSAAPQHRTQQLGLVSHLPGKLS